MCGSSPRAPTPAALLPEAPTIATPSTMTSDSAAKRRRAASTILTSAQGATGAASLGTGVKTLLGQ